MSDNESDQDVEPEPWVRIQKDTFTNWSNEKLRRMDLTIEDIRKDFRDGIRLCKLVEVLKGRPIGKIITKKRLNHYEASGNLALALQVLSQDGVRLVNIGAEDIAAGNLKLILGLMWILIRKYQIGSESRLPPKKLMLSWVNAVLHPHFEVNNFSTNWNDGIALHGIIEYCRPGTFPNWYRLQSTDRESNCEIAMTQANELFGIPLVVSPENFASHNLDELSGMTYLSYFMMVDSCGHNATLKWVRETITPTQCDNFDTDWNDGFVLSNLVANLGGTVPGWPDDIDRGSGAIKRAMFVSETDLGVPKLLTEKDMVKEDVDHIGVMAYAAWHQSLCTNVGSPLIPPPAPPVLRPVPVEPLPPTPVVRTPPPPPLVMPVVTNAKLDVVTPHNWRLGASATVQVNTSALNAQGDGPVKASGHNPFGREEDLAVHKIDDHQYHVIFLPDRKGEWTLKFSCNGKFDERRTVNVYDPAAARMTRSHFGPIQPDHPYSFEVQTSNVGLDDVHAIIQHGGRVVQSNVTKSDVNQSTVTFTPEVAGLYSVGVYVGGVEIQDSPFTMECESVGEVFASGEGLHTGVVFKKAFFDVDTTNFPGKSLKCVITSPNGDQLDTESSMRGSRIMLSYSPKQTGQHTVDLHYAGIPLPGSPYSVNILPPKVFIRNLKPVAYRNQETRFEMDASEYTKGTIELDSNLPVRRYDKIGERRYEVTIVPMKLGVHDLTIKMDSMEVEGSPFRVEVREPDRY